MSAPRSAVSGANYDSLVEAACKARKTAYAPYSKFLVGAALLCEDGSVVTGCNVENASYGLTCCAERTAIFSAIAAGKKNFKAIAIALDSPDPAAPCGACRQVIFEFGSNIEVVMASSRGGAYDVMTISDLLPRAFGPSSL